jgi:hypothetical protein
MVLTNLTDKIIDEIIAQFGNVLKLDLSKNGNSDFILYYIILLLTS